MNSFAGISYADLDDLDIDDISYESVDEGCEETGGETKTFFNGCANYCSYEESGRSLFCTQAMTESCQCPDEQCFDKSKNICRDF